MRSVDSTFCFDLLQREAGATRRAKELDDSDEHLTIAAPALLEVLEGGYRRGGRYLERVTEMLARFEVLEIGLLEADQAARIGAECISRGQTVPHMDLLIAAACRRQGQVLITRDPDFSRIPGLTVESY
ncbi:MAG TPA: type II toxin-antitoxin system VapC family toxin [Thermoplasmata archaeon]|nr:type II toxin-antitoxin system VapC family toxin [Thermoplasmata archaeon]